MGGHAAAWHYFLYYYLFILRAQPIKSESWPGVEPVTPLRRRVPRYGTSPSPDRVGARPPRPAWAGGGRGGAEHLVWRDAVYRGRAYLQEAGLARAGELNSLHQKNRLSGAGEFFETARLCHFCTKCKSLAFGTSGNKQESLEPMSAAAAPSRWNMACLCTV